jgi:diguanylate cyclase (GGDEF)-like protein
VADSVLNSHPGVAPSAATSKAGGKPVRSVGQDRQDGSRRALYGWLAASGTVLCAVLAVSLRGDPLIADGVGYFCYLPCFLAAAAVCIPFARRERGAARLRWLFFSVACAYEALDFLLAGLTRMGWLYFAYSQFMGAWLHALSGSLLLLAATLLIANASRSMIALDTAQTVLFCILRFFLIFAPREKDLFDRNHLLVSTAILGFLLLTSLAGWVGSVSRSEARFLRLLSIFLALQCVGVFLMNQVSFVWLHNPGGSLWDAAEIPLTLGFVAIAIHFYSRPEPALPRARRSVLLRNLMPSFLALGNVALGLVLLQEYPSAAITGIMLAVLGYGLRTGLLQAEASQERELLSEANRRLEHLATRDALTGAGNRRSLISALINMTHSPDMEFFSLVLIDADWFKQANDHHGHLHGDQVLVAIAELLRGSVAAVPDAHCARLGGDEFALLLPNCDSGAAFEFAEEVRQGVKALALQAGERTISVSVGATVSTLAAGLTFESLMSRADEALYRAKTLGRNRVEILA